MTKNLPIRFVGEGGDKLRAEFVGLGKAGKEAMGEIGRSAAPAASGLQKVESAAESTMSSFDQLSARTAAASNQFRMLGNAQSAMQSRINAATGVSSPTGMSSREILEQGRALDQLRAKYNPLYAEVRRYRQSLSEIRSAHLQGAISAEEMTAAIGRERTQALASIAAIKGRTSALYGMRDAGFAAAEASRLTGYRMQNLGFQLQDIGVSLAGGMNPLLVMAQQGSQIMGIYSFNGGGVNGLIRDLGKMILSPIKRFPMLTAAVVATGVALKSMQNEINRTSEVQVSFGDTMLAVFEVIGGAIYDKIRPAVQLISGWFKTAWSEAVGFVLWSGDAMINAVKVTIDGIRTAISVVPDLFNSIFSQAVAKAVSKMHDLLWLVGNAVNGVASVMNETFGTNLSTSNLSEVVGTLSESSGNYMRDAVAAEERMRAAWAGFADRSAATFGSSPLGAFFDAVKVEAVANALERTEEAAEGAGGASKKAGEEAAAAAEKAAEGWERLTESLGSYAEGAMDLAGNMGEAMSGAFKKAEDAIVGFVESGKLKVSEFVSSIILDFVRVGTQRYITGPMASGLDGILEGMLSGLGGAATGGAGGAAAGSPWVVYDGGGYTGDAPRTGGLDGKGGFMAVMHPQETVIDHAKGGRAGGGVNVSMTVVTRDAESFRQSRTQVASDLQRAIRAGNRGR